MNNREVGMVSRDLFFLGGIALTGGGVWAEVSPGWACVVMGVMLFGTSLAAELKGQ